MGLVGGSGRMGQAVVACLEDHPQLTLSSILVHRSPLPEPLRPYGVDSLAALIEASHVVVDFSAPALAQQTAALCASASKPLLVASTGLTEMDHEALRLAAQRAPVLVAANLSVGIAVLEELAALATTRLRGFDVEMMELHHRRKRDAPSGTAHLLADAMRDVRPDLQASAPHWGESAARGASNLGVAALRGGDVAGEHTIYFLGDGERIELTHRASGRETFAQGAIRAAYWLSRQTPGYYSMRDVLLGQ